MVAWRWVSERAWEAEEVEAGLKVWAGSGLRRVLTRRPATVRVVGVEGGNDGEVERGWAVETVEMEVTKGKRRWTRFQGAKEVTWTRSLRR